MAPEPAYIYRGAMRSVYDGDTVRADIDLGCNVWIANEPLRLAGINAPEVRGAEREQGLRTRDYLRTLLSEGQEVIIKTFKDKKGKYGRWIALIYLPGEEVSINEILVLEGYAEPFMEDDL